MNQSYKVREIAPNNRGLFSLKRYKAAEKVMQCEPLASATLLSLKSQICNCCLMKGDLFRCSQCKCFYYCSKDCQKRDWTIHKHECKIYQDMTNKKNLSVHKEITSEFVLNLRIALLIRHQKDFTNAFFSMVSLQEFQSVQKMQHFQAMAVVLLENMGEQKSESNIMQMMRQINIVAVNAFTIQDFLCETDGVAIGIYSPASYMNHDCQPNCTQYFDGRYLNIVTSRTIQQSQEMTISYTNPLALVDARRQFLQSNYLFECFCELCQVERMLNTKILAILCPQCQGNISKTEGQQQISYHCKQCAFKLSSTEAEKLLTQIEKYIKQYEQQDQYAELKKKFFSLRKVLSFAHPFFAEAIDKLYHATINHLSQVDAQKQSKLLEQAYILLKEQLKGLKGWYRLQQGEQKNIRFFIKYAQMGKLCYNLQKMQKAYDYTELALNLVRSCQLKHKYQEVTELGLRYEQLRIQISMAKSKTFNAT